MSVMALILVVVGGLTAILALARRPWKVRVRNVQGNTVIGNVGGAVTQTYRGEVPAPPAASSGITAAQVVTWLVALAGVVVAGIGVYINAMKP